MSLFVISSHVPYLPAGGHLNAIVEQYYTPNTILDQDGSVNDYSSTGV